MTAYYSEHDPFAAAWLRELMADDLIAPGIVDERSIEDVTPGELAGFTQCHFFAGIGVWSLALRLAGWPDDRPIWTGSCPCQPFSAAGKGAGFADERHLWPALGWLIGECRPPIVIGEQVSSDDGLAWLDVVLADLDQKGYTSGALDTCAAGFGAPHIRQRLYWMGYAERAGQQGRDGPGNVELHGGSGAVRPTAATGSHGRLADAERDGGRADEPRRESQGRTVDGRDRADGRMADAEPNGLVEFAPPRIYGRWETACGDQSATGNPNRPFWNDVDGRREPNRSGPTNGLWHDADWLGCRDGKWRPVAPGTFPLAPTGTIRNRMGALRGAGNALNVAQAQGFIAAMMQELDNG